MKAKKAIAILLALVLALSLCPAISLADDTSADDPFDLSAAIADGTYAWELSEDGTYYALMGVDYETEITNEAYQEFNYYVPAKYVSEIDDDGNIVTNGIIVNGYTAATAPIVFQNNNGGWNSGSAKEVNSDYIDAGFIYVSCGSRSRNAKDDDGNITGKSPMAVVDLKAAVRYIRYNEDVLAGDTDKIVSVGTSGGGQMSTILGASGDMDEYYPYLYETGAVGVEYDASTGTYTSTISDAIYATMAYCPIADINNADLAYAWMRYDSSVGDTRYGFSEFKLALQEDLAYAFCEYINSLNLVDEDGNALGFDVKNGEIVSPRKGSYYDKILENMSDALNAFAENTEWPYSVTSGRGDNATTTEYADMDAFLATYTNTDEWITVNDDGTYSITDMAGFLTGTNLSRNKDIPGFDTLANSAENTAFGTPDMAASHYSATIAAVLKENYEKYSELEGFEEQQANVDEYIEQALDNDYVDNQTYLMNATQIMLNVANGTEEATPSTYWRTRNGTADEHTSFSIAYNVCLAAMANDYDVDYSLVWAMGHGSEEGTTTGTFVDWVMEITDDVRVETPEPLTFWGETYEWEYVPAVENEEYKGLDLTAVAYYKIFNIPYIENAPVYTYSRNETVIQKINIFVPAAYFEDGGWNGTVNGYTIDTAPIIYKNSNSGWNTGLPQKGFQYVWADNGNLAVEDGACLENGFVYITVGSRGRNVASSPAMITDLKAGVRFLRANDDQIPGDSEKLVSIADSGGGAASSLVGSTGDMAEYYPYLYEIGALGVNWIGTTPYDSASDEEKADTANYESTISDAVYAAMMYCPILDLNNADIAYAWMHFDDGLTGTANGGTTFTEYQLELQNDLAESFIDYVNGLELLRPYSSEVLVLDDGEDGTTLGDARDGTYYQAVLDEMSKALTAYIANEEWKTQNTAGYSLPFTYPYADCKDAEDYLMTAYGDYNEGTPDEWDWLEIDGDVYTITDMAGFINGTNLSRNKNITAFDALNRGGEGNIAGNDNVYIVDGETIKDDGNSSEVANADAVTVSQSPAYHISKATADVIKNNMADGLSGDTYSTYEEWLYMLWNHSTNESTAVTFNEDDNGWKMEFDGGDFEALVTEQAWLYNVTTILQDYIDAKENGTLDEMATPEGPTVAQHWRSRNGTADYHTSFT
ncbi:MAG: hypothetical protein LUE06_03165, partial [Oscillospiraceae bacterium]|nr:hypothetical protein [Oscillospiraceae bacterium]